MSMWQFYQNDETKGKPGQDIAEEFLWSVPNVVWVDDVSKNPEYFNKGDFVATTKKEVQLLIDSKYDNLAGKTGNLGIEVSDDIVHHTPGWFQKYVENNTHRIIVVCPSCNSLYTYRVDNMAKFIADHPNLREVITYDGYNHDAEQTDRRGLLKLVPMSIYRKEYNLREYQYVNYDGKYQFTRVA